MPGPLVLDVIRREMGQALWTAREFRLGERWSRSVRALRGSRLPSLRHIKGKTGIWAVTMVRDEQDVIELTIQHLLSQGVDHVLVADNRSTDRTPEILSRLAAQHPNVHVAFDAEPAYYQSEKMTWLSTVAALHGAEWVIPFDADEFWFASGTTVSAWLKAQPGHVAVAKAAFHNMAPTADGMLSRNTAFSMDATPHVPGKVAFRAHPLAIVSVGNHGVARVGDVVDGLFIAHAAYRSSAQVARKLRQGADAVRLTKPKDDIARHWRAGGVLSDDVVDDVWRNLTAGRGDDRIGYHVAGPMVVVCPLGWASWDPTGALPQVSQGDDTLPPLRASIAVYDYALHHRGGGEKHALGIASALSADHDVTVYSRHPVDPAALSGYFGIPLDRCEFRLLPTPSLPVKIALRLKLDSDGVVWVSDPQFHRWFRRQGHTYFVNATHRSLLPSPAPKGLYLCMFPRELPRWQRGRGMIHRALAAAGFRAGQASLDSYSVWAANSQFTAEWIARRWGRRADAILFPPCDDMRDDSVRRRKVILHVGRFFPVVPGENNKRQDVLVEAFTRLEDLHQDGWELHLVGSCDDESSAWFSELRAAGRHLPVYFHTNADHADLRRLYNEASLYWHATGWGTDPEASPASQEHFGITPVEAMSAGAVPLVYATAGPAHTVEDGISGVHWRSLTELVERTRELAGDPARLQQMSTAAQARAATFGRAAFEHAVRTVVSDDLARD